MMALPVRWVMSGFVALAVLVAERCHADTVHPAGLIVWVDADDAAAGPVASIENRAAVGEVFVQPDEAARPVAVPVGSSRVLRFDGRDDHLRCVSGGRSCDSLTLFVVAATHANPGDFRGFFAANAQVSGTTSRVSRSISVQGQLGRWTWSMSREKGLVAPVI